LIFTENRHEIMKFYKHVIVFWEALISIKRWRKAEEKFVSKEDKIIVVTDQARMSL